MSATADSRTIAPLLVWSEKKQRYYRRRFDHDEARRLYAAGHSIADLSQRYGVTKNAISYVVAPGAQERTVAYHRRWRTTTCEKCGGPAMKLVGGKREHNPDGRVLCRVCRSKLMRKPIRVGSEGVKVHCGACDTWKPVNEFPPRVSRALRTGAKVGARCRACDTVQRRRFREARKVPCETCGTLVLPPEEKGSRGGHRPRCRECFYDDLHPSRRQRDPAFSGMPAPVRAEAASTNKEKRSSGA